MTAAGDAYAALETAGGVRAHTALTYRCRARGCQLVRVLRVPAGLLIVWPSARVGARLRLRHVVPMTPGGVTAKWWAEAWPLGRSVVLVGCGHVTASLSADEVRGDMAAGHGAVVALPRDGDAANALAAGPIQNPG